MKSKISIFLCFCIAILAFENAMVFFSFTIHQDQLTESYCIDKYSTDQVMCSGRCVLEFQLSDDLRSSTGEKQMLQQQETMSISYVVPVQHYPIGFPNDHTTKAAFSVQVVEGQLYLSSLFRPPIS